MLLEKVGRQTLGAFNVAVRATELAVETSRSVFRRPFGVRALLTQAFDEALASDCRSVVVGAGLTWKDEDVKTLLGSLSLLK